MNLYDPPCMSCCSKDEIPNWAIGFRAPFKMHSKHIGYYFKDAIQHRVVLDGEVIYDFEEAMAPFDGSSPGWVQRWIQESPGAYTICNNSLVEIHPRTELVRGHVQVSRIS